MDNRTGQESEQLLYRLAQDPFPAVAFDPNFLFEAEPDFGAAEDNGLFDEDDTSVVSAESTEDNFDYNADQALEPSEIAQLYDGRSPQFAPYPLPIHASAARAILPIPLATVPKFSLLVF